jgi:peptide/nickel transport system substrate-binding protein
MRPSRLQAVAGLAAVVVVLGLSGCRGSSTSGGHVTTLSVVVAGATGNLNPTTSPNGWPFDAIFSAAYDPLIVKRPSGFDPGLAVSWGYVGRGNRTFRLTLRRGVRFSDGAALTAAGLKQWIEYYKTQPSIGQGVFANIAAERVTAPLTLTLELRAPDVSLPFELSQDRYGYPISPAALANPAELRSGTYGAGPYAIDRSATVQGTRYAYVRNPYYWNPKGQYWRHVVITVIGNDNSALSAVESGQEMLAFIPPQLAIVAKRGGLAVQAAQAYFASFLILDRGGVLVAPLKNPLVRQALSYAVDRAAVMKALYGAYGTVNDQAQVDGFASYVPDLANAYSYDPAKARRLLAQAGYPHGFTLPVSFAPLGGEQANLAQAVDGYLEKVGIHPKLIIYPSTAAGFAALAALKVAVVPETTFQLEEVDLVVREQMLPGRSLINPFTQTPEPQLTSLYDAAQAASGVARTHVLQVLQRYIVEHAYYVNIGIADAIFARTKSLAPLKISSTQPVPVFDDLRPPG